MCGSLFGVVLLVGLLGGGGEDEEPPETTVRESTTTTEAALPPYEVAERGERELVVLTDEVDAAVLRAIFDQVREDYSGEGDSWMVSINCASIPSTDAADPRTATGEFANTATGLAQTGLETVADVEFATTGLGSCTPPETTTSETTVAPSTDPPTTPPATVATTYGSCEEARAAGAAPLRRGDPGYCPGSSTGLPATP